MSDIFISYARSTEAQAKKIAEALRALGYGVWRDDELPAHRTYAEVIEERLKAAKAVVVIWSAEAVKSQWVQSEADRARSDRKLVQLSLDGSTLPMPFDRIQCADLAGWTGEVGHVGWRKVVTSLAELTGAPAVSVTEAPLALPSKPSVAVMPFANLSGDPEQEYFADGMVEEIATALSRCRSIFVIGAGSSLSFKGKGATPGEAARILGVRYILEGSVRNAANRVRIAVKLTDSKDGAQIWADRFEDTLEDVFALQDRVALSVVGVIEPAVREADMRRATARPTENMGSYDLALQGMSRYRTWAAHDVQAGMELLDRAVALDPNYGMALAMAALCRAFQVIYEWCDDPATRLREARSLIDRAMGAAPDDSEVLATLSTAVIMVVGPAQAAALAKRATILNPGSSLAWIACGIVSIISGDNQLGMEQLKTALRLDPRSAWEGEMLSFMGMAHFAQGQFVEAVALLRQGLQLRPHWALPRAALAASYGHLGELTEAREALAQMHAVTSIDPKQAFRAWSDPAMARLVVEGIAKTERPEVNSQDD